MGWFRSASELKSAAVRPIARAGSMVTLAALAGLIVVSSASAGPAEGARGVELGTRLDLALEGRIVERCQIHGGGDVDLGELTAGKEMSASFGLDCNIPFQIDLRSGRGGLVHTTQPLGEGPFSGSLIYDLKVVVPTLRPRGEKVRVEAGFSSMELTGVGSLSSGEGISSGPGEISLRMRAPSGVGLLAGQYTETLTVMIVPRV